MTLKTKLDTSPRVLSKNPNKVRKEVLDLRGETYGELTVEEFAGTNKRGSAYWKCLCSCSKYVTVSSQSLRAGATKSCGHVSIEKASDRLSKLTKTHGASNEPWYNNYVSMIRRTTNKRSDAYWEYRERHPNIKKWIEESWINNPWEFYKEIGEKPGNEYSIDRIDNNKGYVHNNIRWATYIEQAHNRNITPNKTTGFIGVGYIKTGTNRMRASVYSAYITFDGKTYSLGHYDDIEDAKIARWREEEKLGIKHTFDIIKDREPKKHTPLEASNRVYIEVGDTIGLLTIVKEVDSRHYMCKCKCGNVVERSKTTLLKNDKIDCGDYNVHRNRTKIVNGELTNSHRSDFYKNKKYGNLTLLEFAYAKGTNLYWTAKCDCGNVITVTIGSLISGHTKTCGHSIYKYIITNSEGHTKVFSTPKEVKAHFGVKAFRTGDVNIPFKVTSKKSKLYGYTIVKKPTLDTIE